MSKIISLSLTSIVLVAALTAGQFPSPVNPKAAQNTQLKALKATPAWQDMNDSYQTLTNQLDIFDNRIVSTTNAIAKVADSNTVTALNKLWKNEQDLRAAFDAQTNLDKDYKLIIKAVVTNNVAP